jgi:nucleoside phosphorylase
MKDWITYLKENLENDIWGFIFLDYYYNYSSEKHGNSIEKYEPEKFINENIEQLYDSIKDPVHFHKVFLKICVQLLFDSKKSFDSSKIHIFNKSYNFLVKHKKNLSDSQVEDLITHYGNSNDEKSYRKKEEFEQYLISKDFIKKSSDKTRHSIPKKSNKKIITEASEEMKGIQLPNTEIKSNKLKKNPTKVIRKAILVSAIEEEFQMLNDYFSSPTITEHHPKTKKAYQKGIFETNTTVWEIMLVETGKFNDESMTETALLIDYYSPELALFIGTAGRLDKSLGIGDIIVPPVVVGYNYGKDLKQITKISLNNIRHPSPALIEYAKAIKRDVHFLKKLREDTGNFPDSKFNIIIDEDKQIASGNMTVKDFNSRTARTIRKLFPDAIAVDMEGLGFFKACKKFNIEYLLIRGIADYLKNKKAVNIAGSRELTMSKAAVFAFEILKRNV